MNRMKYQYRIYNDFFDYIVTILNKSDEHAINVGRSVAMDYYKLEEKYVQDVKCEFITEFFFESVINLNLLKTK